MTQILHGMTPIGQYVPQKTFKPNLELLGKAMDKKQKLQDASGRHLKSITAKIDRVNRLEGDTKQYKAKRADIMSKIADLEKKYQGDWTKATSDLEALSDDVGRAFGPNGVFTAMQGNYDYAQKTYAELKKRREKGDIGDGGLAEYQRQIQRYNESGGVGFDKDNWKQWRMATISDYVDEDKFLNEFVANKKASLEDLNYSRVYDNQSKQYIYTHKSRKAITEESLQHEAKSALRNAMEDTGQLKWEFLHARDQGAYKEPDKLLFLKGQREMYTSATKIATDLKKYVEDKDFNGLAKYLGEVYNRPGEFTSHNEATLVKIANQAQEANLNVAKRAEHMYSAVEPLTNEEYSDFGYHIDRYADEVVGGRVKPYAEAVSFEEEYSKRKYVADPEADFQYKLKLEQAKLKNAKDLYDYKFQTDEANNMITAALPYDNKEGTLKSAADGIKITKGLIEQGKQLNGQLRSVFADQGSQKAYDEGMVAFREKFGRLPTAEELAGMEIMYQDGSQNGNAFGYNTVGGSGQKGSYVRIPSGKDADGKPTYTTIKLSDKEIDSDLAMGFKQKALQLHEAQKQVEDRMNYAYYMEIKKAMPNIDHKEALELANTMRKNNSVGGTSGIFGGLGNITKENLASKLQISTDRIANANSIRSALGKGDKNEAIKLLNNQLKALEKLYDVGLDKSGFNGEYWKEQGAAKYEKAKQSILDNIEKIQSMSTAEAATENSNWFVRQIWSKLDFSAATHIEAELKSLDNVMRNAQTDDKYLQKLLTQNPALFNTLGFDASEINTLKSISKNPELKKLATGKKQGAVDQHLAQSANMTSSDIASNSFGYGDATNKDLAKDITSFWNSNSATLNGVQIGNITVGDEELSDAFKGVKNMNQLKRVASEAGYSLKRTTGVSVQFDGSGIPKIRPNILLVDEDGKEVSASFPAIGGFTATATTSPQLTLAATVESLKKKTVSPYGAVGEATDVKILNSLTGELINFDYESNGDKGEEVFFNKPYNFAGITFEDGSRYDTDKVLQKVAENQVVGGMIAQNYPGYYPPTNGYNKRVREITSNALIQVFTNNSTKELIFPSDSEKYQTRLKQVTAMINYQIAAERNSANGENTVEIIEEVSEDQVARITNAYHEQAINVARIGRNNRLVDGAPVGYGNVEY